MSQNPTADAALSREIEPRAKHRSRPTPIPRARTLDELEAQFTAIGTQAHALVESAGVGLCEKPPAPGSWTVAQCLQHLNVSTDAYFPIWQQVIANAGPRKAELNAPYVTDFWGRLFSWILEPPARIRSKTPLPFQPIDCKEIAVVLAGFLDRQQRIAAALHRCRGRAIDQVKFASPVDARVRYSIWSSFLIVVAHQRRHLWQAEQVVQKLRSTP